MSSYRQPNIQTFQATAAMAAFKVVKPGADAKHVQVASAATDKAIGIAQNAPSAADESMEVAMPGGGGKALLGGSVSFGDFLASDSNGALVATTTANNKVIAQAMSDGSSGDVIPVEVVSFNY